MTRAREQQVSLSNTVIVKVALQQNLWVVELIETHFIAWLEMEFVPKTYSQEQIDELDRLTETWVNDYYGQRQTVLK